MSVPTAHRLRHDLGNRHVCDCVTVCVRVGRAWVCVCECGGDVCV